MNKSKSSAMDRPKESWIKRLPSPAELSLTLVAVGVLIAAAVLSVLDIGGSSLLAIAGIVASILVIARYRVETLRAKRTTVKR